MSDSERFTALARERFVALTTFRKDGTPVPTTVWVAGDGADLVVTTPVDGSVTIGDPAQDPGEFARLSALFPAKYGVEYRLMRVVTRGRGADRFMRRISVA